MSRIGKYISILAGAAAALGVVSAIGSTCVSLDPFWQKGPFAIAGDYPEIWLVTYFLTWISALAWGVLWWAFRTRKAWFYKVAIINCIIGAIGRGIPALLMSIGFFSTPRTGLLFTPSWAIALLNVIILIILLIPSAKSGIRAHIGEASGLSGGGLGDEVAEFAFVLFGLGIALMVQPFIMPTHIIGGVNIGVDRFGTLLASGSLQLFSGLLCFTLGIIVQITGRLINAVYTPKQRSIETQLRS